MSQRNPQQGLQRRPQQGGVAPVSGTVTRLPQNLTTMDPLEATSWIDDAYQNQGGKVVAPFAQTPSMAPGWGVAYSQVPIKDWSPQGADIYPIKGQAGKFGLHKGPLDAIGRGFGIDWPVPWTFDEKFNDERDHDAYCKKITVAGRYRDADGEWKTLPPQTKEIDLRDGQSEVEEIRARHLRKQTDDLPPDATPQALAKRQEIAKLNADAEIAQLRKFIRDHALTKARLKVIRTLVRSSYTLEELKNGPFHCFRMIKTYRAPADRPELQARLDDLAIQRLTESSEALYGQSPQHALPPVDDKPYNAELTEYERAIAAAQADAPTGDSADGQGDSSEATTVTVQGQETSNQPVQRQCTAETGCLGAEPGIRHILACYGKTEAEPTQAGNEGEAEEQPWILQQGPAKNLAVNDSKVRAETLIQMEHELAGALNPKGLFYAGLSDEQKDLFSSELRMIGRELDRRKVTEGRLAK